MKILQVIVDRWKAILTLGLLLSALAAWPASQLRILTDVSDLLPDGSRSTADYKVFLQRFGGLQKVLVAVVADDDLDSEAARDLVTDSADRLASMLSEESEVVNARSGIESDDERFALDHLLPRSLLLMDGDWRGVLRRATTPDALDARIQSIRSSVASPLGMSIADLIAADPLGLASDLSILTPDSGVMQIDPVTLANLSLDGRASLVVVTPAGAEIDAAGGRTLARTLDSAFDQLRASTGGKVSFAAIGGPLYAAHDEEIIRADLNYMLSGALLGCALLVTLAFGSLVLPLASIFSVAVGLVVTMMLLRFGLGSISSIGVGFGAVLVGLGLDYGIHGTSQYCQQRLAGLDTLAALRGTFGTAGPGILTSAITTAVAFVVIFMAQVRPVWELGLVVSVGIVVILFTTATIGAAFLVGADVAGGLALPSGHGWRVLGWIVDRCVTLATTRPTLILALALGATGAAAFGMASLELTPDLRSMRPTHHPTVIAEQTLMRHFPVGLDTVTFVTSGGTMDQALDNAARIESILRDHVGEEVSITSPTTWLGVPSVIDSRLQALARGPLNDAVDDFERRLRPAGLDIEGFKDGLDALRALGRGRDPGIPPREAWPEWLEELMHIENGVVSIAVLLRLNDGVWPDGPPESIRRLIDEQVPGVAVASISGVGRELREIAGQDLRRLGGAALLAIAVVVLLSFRGRIRPAVLALTPVVLGAFWTVGLWGLSGRSIDLFGVAVLPIVLGIGIDDGLHAVHGARHHSTDPIASSVRASGRAILLTTLTTMVGFGCLAFSHVPGLRRGGVLVSLGVLACLAATIFVLPALESRFSRKTWNPNTAPRSARYAPRTGLMRRMLGDFHVTGVFWFRFHLWGVSILPKPGVAVIITVFTTFFFFTIWNIRRAIASNLSVALGPCGWWERQKRIYKTMWEFAWCRSERYETVGTDRRVECVVEGKEIWDRLLAHEKGFVLVTAHVGHWEIGSTLPAGEAGRRVHLVREMELDPKAQEFIAQIIRERSDDALLVHFAGEHEPTLGLELLSSLRRGEIVALQGDRPRAAGGAVPATLFGRSTDMPGGPATLARAAGVPILPVFVFREGRLRSRLVLREAIHISDTGEPRADIQRAVQQVADQLEWAIRQKPHQWFCFRELWSD